MNWFFIVNEVQEGPVSTEDLTRLFQSGTVTGETMVWHEGMQDWQPYHAVPDAPTSNVPAAPPAVPHRVAVPKQAVPVARPVASRPAVTPAVWRKGKRLLMARNAMLPRRCIRCGKEAFTRNESGKTVEVQLRWRHPVEWFFFLCIVPVFFWLLFIFKKGNGLNIKAMDFMLLLAFSIRCLVVLFALDWILPSKKVEIFVTLCPRHSRAKSRNLVIGWLMLAAGLGLFALLLLGIGFPNVGFPILPLMVAGMIFLRLGKTVLRPTWIDARFLTLKGVSPVFLDHLPEFPTEKSGA